MRRRGRTALKAASVTCRKRRIEIGATHLCKRRPAEQPHSRFEEVYERVLELRQRVLYAQRIEVLVQILVLRDVEELRDEVDTKSAGRTASGRGSERTSCVRSRIPRS